MSNTKTSSPEINVVSDAYAQQVRELASLGVNYSISNKSKSHAKVLIENIFLFAKSTVRVYCGSFDETFYSNQDLMKSLTNFLDKEGVRFLLLTENKVENTHFIKKMQSDDSGRFKDRLFIKHLPEAATLVNSSHFALMDDRGYRIELGHDTNNPDKVEAYANFNDPQKTAILIELFEELWRISKE